MYPIVTMMIMIIVLLLMMMMLVVVMVIEYIYEKLNNMQRNMRTDKGNLTWARGIKKKPSCIVVSEWK